MYNLIKRINKFHSTQSTNIINILKIFEICFKCIDSFYLVIIKDKNIRDFIW